MAGPHQKIKRVGHGFRNYANYRLRLLLHCGVDWNTNRATPIRERLPRSAAESRQQTAKHEGLPADLDVVVAEPVRIRG